MNYFTPDLIARGQSSDSRVLDEVETLWDEQCDRYQAQLQSIEKELPPGLRRIVENYYLHDAKIHGIGRQHRSFFFVLQLDTPPQALLAFTYHLVEEPSISFVLNEAARSKGGAVEWWYDEIDKVAGEALTWRQSILLSNGWEVSLHFQDVQVEEMQAILPAPRNSAAPIPVLPQSA
jgi:hypothetical protein